MKITGIHIMIIGSMLTLCVVIYLLIFGHDIPFVFWLASFSILVNTVVVIIKNKKQKK